MASYEKEVLADPEKASAQDVVPAYQSDSPGETFNREEFDKMSFWTRNGFTLESFKRRKGYDSSNQLNQTMKTRHLHMIAIGGSIGAGFFVGSGGALHKGGPGALLIDFGLIGIMMFNVVYALGELAIMYPVSGGFYTYSTRFIDPSWGFAMGWNYVFQWAIVLPLELTVAAITIDYWPNDVSVAVWITIFLLVIIFINVWGVLGYAEEEFWSSILKLGATVVFMIICLIMVCGGGPERGRYHEYWGARTWYNPGAFANGFKGVCAVFVTAAFSFSGTELVGLAAAESRNPVKQLPGAIKQVFWRITLFYVLGLFFVGLLIPHDDENLFGANPYVDTNASPFVLVGKYAGLKGFDSFMNVVIMVSVISIGMSGVYGGSRTLTALAEQGYAPRIFSYVDKSGRPLFSVIFVCAFGPLAYINLSASGPIVFDWLLALSGLAALFTWGSICLAHIRFRAAWAHNGHTLDELPFRAAGGVYGSWLGLILIILVLIAQFYIALFPLGGSPSAENFFKQYLALPIVMLFWVCGYFWKRTGWLTLDKIDVDSGRRDLDMEEVRAYNAERSSWPVWKRVMHIMI